MICDWTREPQFFYKALVFIANTGGLFFSLILYHRQSSCTESTIFNAFVVQSDILCVVFHYQKTKQLNTLQCY